MELSEYVAMLYRHAVAIVVIAILGALCGFGLARSSTPLYKATSSSFVSATIGDNSSDLVQGSVYTQNLMQSYAQLVGVPSVLSPVIAELGLTQTPAQLAKAVSADAPLNTVLIVVTVVDESPTEAARIANAVSASLSTTAQDLAPKNAKGAAAISMRQVAEASPPVAAFSPNTSLMVALGGAAGMFLATGFYLGRRMLNTRVSTAADLNAAEPWPVLGAIATVRGNARQVEARRVAQGGTSHETFQRVADQVHHLDLSTQIRSVVVTSAALGEGKTHVALNLALAMAERVDKVLLVDANLRTSQIAEICGLEKSAGLSEVINGSAMLPDAVQRWRAISVLHAGKPVNDPIHVLNSRKMADLVSALVVEYDFVVFDSAAVLPVADSLPLTRLTDGAILVVQLHKTPKAQMMAALNSIRNSKGRMVGLLVNRSAGTLRKRDRYPGPEIPAVNNQSLISAVRVRLGLSP